jgi:hypothetical protein
MFQAWLQRQAQVRFRHVAILCGLMTISAWVLQTAGADPSVTRRLAALRPVDAFSQSSSMDASDGGIRPCPGKSLPNPILAQVIVADGLGRPVPLTDFDAHCTVVSFLRTGASSFRTDVRRLQQLQLETIQSTGDGSAWLFVLPDSEREVARSVQLFYTENPTFFYDVRSHAASLLKVEHTPTVMVYDRRWQLLLDGRGYSGTIPFDRLRRVVRTAIPKTPATRRED